MDKPLFTGFDAADFAYFAQARTANRTARGSSERAQVTEEGRRVLAKVRALAEAVAVPLSEQAPDLTYATSRASIGDFAYRLWFAFYRRQSRSKDEDAQLGFCIRGDGVSIGFGFGSPRGAHARAMLDTVRQTFRKRTQMDSERFTEYLLRLTTSGYMLRRRWWVAPGTASLTLSGFSRTDSPAVVFDYTPAEVIAQRVELAARVVDCFAALLPVYRYVYELPRTGDHKRRTIDEGRSAVGRGFEREREERQRSVRESDTDYQIQEPGSSSTHRPSSILHRPFSAADFLHATYLPPIWLSEFEALLADRRQLIFYGPPGTGKTFVAQHAARWLTDGDTQRVATVQFHPSYAYEEFIEGIRPAVAEHGTLGYVVQPGIFRLFCETAARDPDNTYVLIIDEINRAPTARVFGELLYLLEYRQGEVELPYSRQPFSVPVNLVILGTMNTADRAIALVDFALRRRFAFMHFAPDESLLTAWLDDHPEADRRALSCFRIANAQITDPDYGIGHSVWMRPTLDEDALRRIWEYTVYPYLAEYFFNNRTVLADLTWATVRKQIGEAT